MSGFIYIYIYIVWTEGVFGCKTIEKTWNVFSKKIWTCYREGGLSERAVPHFWIFETQDRVGVGAVSGNWMWICDYRRDVPINKTPGVRRTWFRWVFTLLKKGSQRKVINPYSHKEKTQYIKGLESVAVKEGKDVSYSRLFRVPLNVNLSGVDICSVKSLSSPPLQQGGWHGH